ncbi:putative pentatricopeptide repeat-containing protein [Citrus sinensis]|nr:putative pentatricopeptide repeat-containing protein [Citrus sinensis]
MRKLSSSASRAKPSLKNLPEESSNPKSFNKQSPSRPKLYPSFDHDNNSKTEASSRGILSISSSSLNSHNFSKLNFVTLSSNHVSPHSDVKLIDHHYISQALARKDWFLLLSHELKANRINLVPRVAVSILQNQENPIHSLRFYIWASNINLLLAKDQSVKGVLGNVLHRMGPVILSVELLKDIKNSGFQIGEDLLCVLIGSWGRLGLAKYCADIFGQISFLGISPSTRLYNAVIDALVKSNSIDLAYLKFQQMSVDQCKPDRFTYNILIHGVCRIGVVDEALRLVKQMEGLGYAPNVYTYTILIDGFCNAKRVAEVFRVLEIMKERNVCPNEATVRSLVHGVFRCLDPHKAFELLIRFMEREPLTQKLVCNTLLYRLSNNSMASEAAAILRKMGDRGYLPESSTFDYTVTCLVTGLDLNETCGILDTFIKRGVKPRFSTYLLLMEALYKAGRDVEGDRYLNHVFKDRLVSNVNSYNMVIDCFCKVNMMDRATEICREMRDRDIAPNLVTFNTLISGHCKDAEVHKTRELLVMLLECGFKPDKFTFNSMIDCLCRAHRFEDALDCLSEMVEWGVPPNTITYNILIRSLCAIGDVARSLRLFQKMQADRISPDIYTFNALIQSFCRMNKIEKAEKAFFSMLTLGLRPDNFSYSALIKALIKSGRFDEAKQTFLSMEQNGCNPDSYTSNLILETLVQQGRFEEAHDIVKTSKERGISFKSFPAFTMAYIVKLELWLSAVILICITIFCCSLGKAQEETVPESGVAGGDPTQIVAKALLCFNDKYVYSSCEQSYRLTENGNINVPPDYTDKYCNGPCLTETNLVLDCIENIMLHFKFYNKATIQDIRDTIKAGCSHGPEKGNFNVSKHIQTQGSSAYKAAYKVLFGLGLMIMSMHDLSPNFGDQNVPGSKWEAPDAKRTDILQPGAGNCCHKLALSGNSDEESCVYILLNLKSDKFALWNKQIQNWCECEIEGEDDDNPFVDVISFNGCFCLLTKYYDVHVVDIKTACSKAKRSQRRTVASMKAQS